MPNQEPDTRLPVTITTHRLGSHVLSSYIDIEVHSDDPSCYKHSRVLNHAYPGNLINQIAVPLLELSRAIGINITLKDEDYEDKRPAPSMFIHDQEALKNQDDIRLVWVELDREDGLFVRYGGTVRDAIAWIRNNADEVIEDTVALDLLSDCYGCVTTDGQYLTSSVEDIDP